MNNYYVSLSRDELYAIMLILDFRLNQKKITPGAAQVHGRIFGEIPLTKFQMIKVIKAHLRNHIDPIIDSNKFEDHILKSNNTYFNK